MADPLARLARIRNGLTPAEWGKAGAMAAVIIGLNVLGWLMLAAAVGGHYHITGKEIFGFGTGILAYTLGMRHAFDADHIAAIDNTTRKLIQDGKRPLSASGSSSPSGTPPSCSRSRCCSTSASARWMARLRTTAQGCTIRPASSAPPCPGRSCTSSPC